MAWGKLLTLCLSFLTCKTVILISSSRVFTSIKNSRFKVIGMMLGVLISGSLTHPVATQMHYQPSRKDKLCIVMFHLSVSTYHGRV